MNNGFVGKVQVNSPKQSYQLMKISVIHSISFPNKYK